MPTPLVTMCCYSISSVSCTTARDWSIHSGHWKQLPYSSGRGSSSWKSNWI